MSLQTATPQQLIAELIARVTEDGELTEADAAWMGAELAAAPAYRGRPAIWDDWDD